ncbi:aldose 1-epimerase family protein [Flavobacterium sp.]
MIVSISNQNLLVKIDSNGAELISLLNLPSPKEFIWGGNPTFWARHSPILFPIVGSLKNNSYNYNDTVYSMKRHGFARNLKFKIQNQTENSVTFILLSNEFTKLEYPFDFELVVTFKLIANSLEVSYIINNTGNQILPFSIGGHPAFALNEDFENYSLAFERNEKLKCYNLQNDLISNEVEILQLINKKLPLTYSLFQKDALIIKQMMSKEISILKNDVPFLKFKFDDFPNFGIWTKVGAPFVCLEPWVGYADTFESSGQILEKEGIQLLKTNSKKKYSYSMTIL